MVNMNVEYRRSCRSLLQLQKEIRQWRPGREQNKGFMTGYAELALTGMLSGHYPDHNGITFGYDIGVDIEGDGSGLTVADAERLFEYLTEKCHPRFQYAIYARQIEGNHTGWSSVPYYGSSPHLDHIHISVVDVEYGEPSGVPASVFDSEESWGVVEALGGTKPQAGTVRPIKRPKPAKGKQYVTLPAGVESWAIYKLGVAPVAGNQFNGLNTQRYGQLTYEIKDWAIPGTVAIIETAQLGRVQIYVAPGTGAKITNSVPPRAEQPAPKPKAKTVSQLAAEVIDGKHGSGDARRRALGSRYAAVQAEVNRRLLGKPSAKSVSQLADEVLAGKHGNGAERQRSLGSRYAAVQAEINRRLS